jgi:hypothetical protein
MRKTAFAFLFLLAPLAYPCGDKLSSVNRGVRLQRAFAGRVLSIVILSSPGLTKEDSDSIRAGLAKVGHRIEVAGSLVEMKTILSASPRDLVLVAAEDVPAVEAALGGSAAVPAVIRILHNPSAAEWRAETKRCPLVMRLPGNTIERLQAIDAAVRPRGAAGANCNASVSASR